MLLSLLLLIFLIGYGRGAEQVWDKVIRDFLVDSKEVHFVKKDFVHMGIILAGIQGRSNHKRTIIVKLEEMLQSLFKHSRGTRIHFIAFTDEESRPHVTGVFRQEMGRYLTESVLFDRQVVGSFFVLLLLLPQVAFPKIRLECVDLVGMVERHREEVDEMKALFGYHHPEGTIIEVHTKLVCLLSKVPPSVQRWRPRTDANPEVHQGPLLHRSPPSQGTTTRPGEIDHA